MTVTSLSYPIDDVIGEDNSFQTILEAQTAGPARRITQLNLQSDGDVFIRICENIRKIVVEKVERQVNSEKGEDDSEGGEDDEGDEEEERNHVLKVHKVIVEAANFPRASVLSRPGPRRARRGDCHDPRTRPDGKLLSVLVLEFPGRPSLARTTSSTI